MCPPLSLQVGLMLGASVDYSEVLSQRVRWEFQVVTGDTDPKGVFPLPARCRLKQPEEFFLAVSEDQMRQPLGAASFKAFTSKGQRDKLGSRSHCSYTHE